jgi:hypothetical protein
MAYRLGIRDAVHLSFILFMLVMAVLLADRYYLKGEREVLDVSPESLGEVESEISWYGIYMQNEKIGYSRTTVARQDTRLICTDHTYLAFKMIGRDKSINTYARAVTDSNLRLLSFIFTITGEDTDFGLRGSVAEDSMSLNITVAGESRVETIPLDEPPQLPSTVQLLLAGREFSQGDRFSTTVFDPSVLSNVQLEIEVLGQETILYNGAQTPVWHIRQELGGMQVDTYIDDRHRLLEERSEIGYRLVLEDEIKARTGNWQEEGTDIQRLVAVVPDRPLPEARQIASIKLELTGVGQDTFNLRGGCQSYEQMVLEVVPCLPLPAQLSDTLPTVIRDVSTSQGSFVQSEHPRLLALAAELIDLEAGDMDKIRSIMRWMDENIEKKPTFSIPNTLEVLERKSGDCNEFAVLFCSLARAAGIPTRIAMGLVYVEDAFYYHAWNECWLGDWVSVDPIFGQFPADATHLRFLAGDMDRQIEILPLVGKVGIKVMDYGTGTGEAR